MGENRVFFFQHYCVVMFKYNLVSFILFSPFNTVNQRPLTNYYQYSLGVLALCTSGIRVTNHVSNKLIKAVEHDRLTHAGVESVGE